MKEGDIVLTPIPQADSRVKNRPAIILRKMPSYGDLLVCGVSTQLHHYLQGFDEIISPTDADFPSSGLVAASLIRLRFLAILPRKKIAGVIGSIDAQQGLVIVRAAVEGPAGTAVLRLALDTGATGTLINVGMLYIVSVRWGQN